MEKLKILVVEDEMIIAESISDMLEDLGYEVTNICIRAKQALEYIADNPPDLALFDIQLKGEETGIWLAQQLKDQSDFPFIFLTSYGDKATIDQAVNMSPYGYLLKPVQKQHLYGAIEVAMHKFLELIRIDSNEEASAQDTIFVKSDYRYVKLNTSEITYIKSEDNYLAIYTEGKKYLIRSTFKEFMNQLPKSHFIRVHRSYVVNLDHAGAFNHSSVDMRGEIIPVSKQYKSAFLSHFNPLG